METVARITKDGIVALVKIDDTADSPRDWDNLWILHLVPSDSRCSSIDEGDADEDENGRPISDGLLVPLDLFEDWQPHVGIDPDPDPDDIRSYAFVTRAQLLKEYGHKIVTARDKAHALAVLKGELDTLNQYYAGDVYGVVIEDEEGEHLDSCWGFYGLDYAKEEAAGMLDYFAMTLADKHAAGMFALDQFAATEVA